MSIYYTWQNVKEEYENNKFKLIGPTWDETFDLSDGNYTIADIQDYFLFIIKEHETGVKSSEESPILIYPNKIKNRIVFKIKAGHKLWLLTNETMVIYKIVNCYILLFQTKVLVNYFLSNHKNTNKNNRLYF